ncbi:glutaredoxin family protein [Micrococcus luteus]|uniref:glutaredoxin domain-containing protein n=1 Tax=Micrococcus luteus TaxID=1270 RepID=UPI0012DE54BE|nr:glutaredoxin domain-containing protein [Micrococcus luteus]MCR4489141.1 glutaredoxin family protein [Micrococcus luteus]MCV7504651.1 glutaredoxin family protein [Micrococcus luteus]MCV7517669.1 glutaredoxin family protein [Micrococcus luteus]MCV7567110.1 glutaredoxin family protein [Micrococcus luteus]MCV7578015.1 glutaredoxin family protein [Micrococcus luteus]
MSQNVLTVYGADWCRDCLRTKRQLDELGVAYDYVDLVADPAQADAAERISGRKNIPVVAFPDGDHQVEPTNEETAAKLTALGLI